MPVFVCDICNAIENAGVGFYWGRNIKRLWSLESLQGKALCSECAPALFGDGSPNRRGGKWHGRFKKEVATIEEIILFGPSRFVYFGPFEGQFNQQGPVL